MSPGIEHIYSRWLYLLVDDDDLVFYVAFNLISRWRKYDNEEALCNEVPYSHELNSTSRGIQIQDLMIQRRER